MKAHRRPSFIELPEEVKDRLAPMRAGVIKDVPK